MSNELEFKRITKQLESRLDRLAVYEQGYYFKWENGDFIVVMDYDINCTYRHCGSDNRWLKLFSETIAKILLNKERLAA